MAIPVFPTSSLPGLTYPIKRTLVWQTIKQEALSGKRTAFALRGAPTYKYEAIFSVLRSSAAFLEQQTLQGFINNLFGGQGLFQYNDPNDGSVTTQTFGIGTGLTASTFQLVRTLGGFVEPVYLPNAGIHIFDNGSDVTANATVANYGVVSFATIAPAAGHTLTWTGTFGWPCRFDDDEIGFENIMFNYFELKSLKFSTELLP